MGASVWVKSVTACLVLGGTLFICAGCSGMLGRSTDPTSAQSTNSAPTVSSVQASASDTAIAHDTRTDFTVLSPKAPDIGLAEVSSPVFTMQVPQGWSIETAGEYETFGFRIYDPEMPSRQIFFYGKMHPFMKSEEGRNAWSLYLQGGGFGGDSEVYAAAPVLYTPSAEGFFHTFGEFSAFAQRFGINHTFPSFSDLEIVESWPRESGMAHAALDDSIVRVLFTKDGLPCEGLLAATVVDAMYAPMYGVDAGFYHVYATVGITARADEFPQLQDVLAQSLATFRYTDSYIQQGVAQIAWETEVALQVGRTLAAAADSYNRAWHARQKVYDTLSQKRSDATLGYDRIYDTETGETYRAELGFYEDYDLHRDEYRNPNLQLVPDDAHDLYGAPVSGYIHE